MSTTLYADVKAKAPLSYNTRHGLLRHWSPRVAKAICLSIYPDFKGNYEQHLWLLTHKATTGSTSYTREAKEKGVLFLWPSHYMNTRVCGPSHYLYYILNWDRPRINALLSGGCIYRRSSRLNAKMLTEALHLYTTLTAFDRKDKLGLRRALDAVVKVKMMLTADNVRKFDQIAYGRP